ncbi:MAG: hypothetical protein ACI97A_000385 [Planctomycetota bacterium]|jgi:hypothetical protein
MSRLLDDIYSSLPSGSDAGPEDRRAVEQNCGDGSSTYGEIHPSAATMLLRWLKLEEDDCLVDCGSGTGRLILQSVFETNVGQAVGIEMSDFRHQIALRAKAEAQLVAESPSLVDRADFLLGDFRDHLPHSTTVIYAGSLCFPATLMTALAAQAHASPRFRALCTLKRLPQGWSSQIREIGELDLEMTWSKNNRLYIYGPKRL